MAYRNVVMYIEIGCFVVCLSGWVLVCSTLPIESWTWSEASKIVLTSPRFFSNLWKDCVSDSTGVSDCKEIPSLLALNWDIHMCRALIITCIVLSFFGTVLVLVGMKCTKIGGSDIANARVTFAGGMNFLIGGMCSMVAFSYFANTLTEGFRDPTFRNKRFDIGVGVFIGWGGSSLLVSGGLVYSIFAGREGCHSGPELYPAYEYSDVYTVVSRQKSLESSAHTEISGSRKSRTFSDSRASSISRVTSTTKGIATSAYV